MKQSPSWVQKRRRQFLQLGGLVTVGGLLEAARGADESADNSFVLEQDDRCLSVTPLSGSAPVEDLYDYTYPARYGGPPGSDGNTFSSEGTTDLQRDRTSLLFLYDGPEGLNLVILHGRVDGERDAGGTVTFTIRGLPTDGEWLVRDDYYLENGEPADSNYDRWDIDGDTHTVDWAYISGRTDGGAFHSVGTDFEITIEPAFNDDAALATNHDVGPIEAWELLSGDRDAPDRYPLRLDRPVTIRPGTCEADGDGGGDGGTGDNQDDSGTDGDGETGGDNQDGSETDESEDDQEQDGDREEDTKTETKHQKKQRKHREKQQKHKKKKRKHQKKQRKHQKKQRKHAKKRQKHAKKQQKHQKKRQKHQKKQQKHKEK